MSNPRSQYERKLARQRQLELMEAAASGTVPSMELDTALAEAQLRSRTEEARLLQQQQQQQQMQQTRESGLRTTQLFERPDSVRPSVNLMDHDTGIYQESMSFRQQVGAFFKSLLVRSEFDAAPSDDYVGQKPRRRTSKSRIVNFHANCIIFIKRNRRLCTVLAMILLITIITASTVNFFKARPTKVLMRGNAQRHAQIQELMISQGLSHPETFDDPQKAEYHAIRWISYSDPMRLPVNDPNLSQRYALAVFFYGSYLSFRKRAGSQNFDQLENLSEGVPNPGWIRHDNWLTGKGYCTWYGIQCKQRKIDSKTSMHYDDNDEIVTLDMDHNHIVGTLPMEFKALFYLTYLDLSGNRLSGSFPYQIARNFNIQHLLLNNNALTGTLPTWMGQMEQIRELRFGYNQLKGRIPTEINRMFNLKILTLQNNQLTGPLPSLKNLKKLNLIDIESNALTGTLSYELGFLRELEVLRLGDNRFTGTFPNQVNNIAPLQRLEVDHNQMHGQISDILFERLKFLRLVDFQHNHFTGTVPAPLGTLKHIEVAFFNNNNFTGPMPQWSESYALRKVHVQENMISGSLPGELGMLTNLEELWMNDNLFIGGVHAQWGNLTKLVTLQLENNQLTGMLPSELAGMTSLQSLRIQGNNMAGTMTPEVCALTKTGELKSLAVDCSVQCECCGSCYNG